MGTRVRYSWAETNLGAREWSRHRDQMRCRGSRVGTRFRGDGWAPESAAGWAKKGHSKDYGVLGPGKIQ